MDAMKDVGSLAIGGVSLLVLVIGWVEFAKRLGLQGKASMVLAVVLGPVFAVTYYVMQVYPVIAPWVQYLVMGMAIGLGATGIYDVAKRLSRGEQPES